MSVDQGPFYPASDTNNGQPAQIVVRSMVRRSDRSYMLFQLYSILHAQYLSSTDAYSALHLLVMYVQVLSIQIMHRSVLDLHFSRINGESSYSEDNSHEFLFSIFSPLVSVLLDIVGACP
ncbi:hypothetical protein MTR67_044480, partial [Solanum verrucosum]